MIEEQIYNFLLEGRLNRTEYFFYSAIWSTVFVSGLPFRILPTPLCELLLIAGNLVLTYKRGRDIGWGNKKTLFLFALGYLFPLMSPKFLLLPVPWLIFLFIPGKPKVRLQTNIDTNYITITCGRCSKKLKFLKGKGVFMARCPNCLNQFRIST